MAGMTEDGLENLVIEWLVALGWQYAFGPDIAPDMPGAERADYREVILEGRLADGSSVTADHTQGTVSITPA